MESSKTENATGTEEKIRRRQVLSDSSSSSRGRRGFLGRLLGLAGTGLAAISGFSRGAVAMGETKQQALIDAAKPYDSSERIRDALRSHGRDLLAELSQRGHLETNDVKELPTDVLYRSVESFASAEEGAIAIGMYRDGNPTARVEIRKRLSNGRRLVVVVVPDSSRSYAVVTAAGRPPRFAAIQETEVISPSDDCVACYYEEKECWVGCGPDSCSCVDIGYPTECTDHCCYIIENCTSTCSETC